MCTFKIGDYINADRNEEHNTNKNPTLDGLVGKPKAKTILE
jgi:hypothetical protein